MSGASTTGHVQPCIVSACPTSSAMRGSVSSMSEMMVGAMYLEEGLVSPPTNTFPRVDWSTFCKRLTGREEGERKEGRGREEKRGGEKQLMMDNKSRRAEEK